MKKILLLTLANLRKAKSQAVSFFGMALIAALLLSLGLVTWLNYDNNFHKKGVELNTEHGLLATQNNTPEGIRAVKAEFEGDNQTDVIQESPILFSQASFSYGQGEQSQNIVILNRSDEREMGKTLFVEEDHGINDKPIYLPYLYQTGGGYHMGDDFTLKIGGQSTTYTVAGFYENMMLGSTNLGVSSIMLEDKDYQALSESFAQSIDGTLFSIQLKDKTQNRPYMTEHVSKLTGGLLQNELAGAVYYDLAKQARTMTSSIGSIIVVAFSIIIVGIALIVVRFRIANSIEEGIKNIGVLKAIGYTNNQIAASILLQFLITGVLGCIVGIGLSYAVLPILSAGYAAQTGILWNQGFDGVSACITLLSITIMIALTAGLSLRKIKKLHPIVALRSGLVTHSFRKNWIPLSRYSGNVNLLLSLKMLFQNLRQNVTIILIVSAISFASVFVTVMYYNIASGSHIFDKMVVGEIADVQLSLAAPDQTDQILTEVKNHNDVNQAIYYDMIDTYVEENPALAYITKDFSEVDNQDMCYVGRYPKYKNEVAIGSLMAESIGKKTGDTVNIKAGNVEKPFLITGLIQSGNYMGYDMCIIPEGFQTLVPEYYPDLVNVYLKEGVDRASFITEMKAEYSASQTGVNDFQGMVDGQLGVYVGIISIMTVVILCVTAAVIVLVLYLVIKTLIIQKKQNFGIQKALGYTTRQIIFQLSFSFTLITIIGTICGCIAGYFGVNPMLSLLFRNIGMMKMSFVIPIPLLISLSLGISIFALLISICVCMRIRKITPYSLMGE